MARRSLVPWWIATVVVAFGTWARSMNGQAWRWEDLLAGAAATAAGVWIWKVGRTAASAVMTVAAIGWFLGSAAPTFDIDRAVVERLVFVHRPLLLVALVAISIVRVRSVRWKWFVAGATAVALVVWLAQPPVTVGAGSALVVAALCGLCRLASRPVHELRWWSPWIPPLVWAIAIRPTIDASWLTTSYEFVFAATALLAALAVIPPRPHAERSLAIDLGIVDRRRRRADVRLSIADSGDVVAVSPMATSIDLDDGMRLVVDHPVDASLTPSLRADLRRTGTLMAAHRRLTRELQHQTTLVAASRERLAVATDRERERFRRDVLSTVAPHLDRLVEQLPADAEVVRRLVAEARREVDDLCAGGQPAALADGLSQAIRALAASCPVPVDVTIDAMPGSLEDERAAWFVVAESVANAVRHAQATRISIELAGENGHTVLRIRDDGRGGGDESKGSGLAGLRRRAAAVGAVLRVASEPGSGTCVELVLPRAMRARAPLEPEPVLSPPVVSAGSVRRRQSGATSAR